MTARWIVIDDATDQIVGWRRGSAGSGLCRAGSTNTVVRIDAREPKQTDEGTRFHGSLIHFIGGALDGVSATVESYDDSDRSVTVSPALPSAPAEGQEYMIVPLASAGQTAVPVTAAQLDAVFSAEKTLSDNGRGRSELQYDAVGRAPVIPVDARPLFDVTVDVAHRLRGNAHAGRLVADGVDELTLTFQALDGSELPDPTYEETITIPLLGESRVELSFTAGVATQAISAETSENFTVSTNRLYRVMTPVTIDVVVSGKITRTARG